MKLEIFLEPVPLGRPRINTTNRGRYLPKSSQQFQDNLKMLVRAKYKGTAIEKELSVTLHFYKPLKPTAQKYGDVDNLAKAVLDACNGILWKDDRLITALKCYKHKGAGKIEIEVIENG